MRRQILFQGAGLSPLVPFPAAALAVLVAITAAMPLYAQVVGVQATNPATNPTAAGQAPVSIAPVSIAPMSITLVEAIRRAEINEPTFAAVRAQAQIVSLDRGIARAALLPNVLYHNQFIYTQPNGLRDTTTGQQNFVFIANDGVHEYFSQASVTETLGLVQAGAVRVANAASARANAELEVARRGLVAATSGLFYGVQASERRLVVLKAANDEAASFVALTEKREAAREAAHADVLKAELTLEQRSRDLADATLVRDRARLELAVLLFADPMTPYTVDLPTQPPPLPAMADVQAAARQRNPDLASALAALRQSDAEVVVAKAAYLPALVLNFAYGIDANQFAKHGRTIDIGTALPPQTPRNLGYSIAGTLDIPVWDWFATEHRVKQTEVRRDAVRVALTAAQKRLVVNLQDNYAEAQTAEHALASLGITVETAQESLRLTELRYTSGEATVLEVVDAETALYGAQAAREDGQVRYQQALSNLEILTGTL
jgi:outer membrane protein TolC